MTATPTTCEYETRHGTCRDCGAEFSYDVRKPADRVQELIARVAHNNRCEPCRTAHAARQEAERIAERDRDRRNKFILESGCPAEFLSYDRAKLPDVGFFDRVMQWRYQPRGLLLAGKTGCGKTRAAWALARRVFCVDYFENPPNDRYRGCHSVAAVDALTLAKYPLWLTSDSERAGELAYALESRGLVILDDVFKSRLSPSVEELIFAIVDSRTANRLPTLITLNGNAQQIRDRFSPDRAEPFLRRLRDYFDNVTPSTR